MGWWVLSVVDAVNSGKQENGLLSISCSPFELYLICSGSMGLQYEYDYYPQVMAWQ
jgi:hypothetical protein